MALKKIQPWHETLVVLKCDTSLSITEIAEKLGKARNTIYTALDNPIIKQKISDRVEQNCTKYGQIRDKIIQKSYERIDQILNMEDDEMPDKFIHAWARVGVEALKGLGEFKEKKSIELDGKLDEFIHAFREIE